MDSVHRDTDDPLPIGDACLRLIAAQLPAFL